MIKTLINKSEEKRFRSHFINTLNDFESNTEDYVLMTKDLSYPYEKHDNGRPLEKYETLVVEVMNLTEKISDMFDVDSISFFANVLYSETILMDRVNQAISQNVPMEHEIIKESMNEILIGQKKAFEQYCNINTNLLKAELEISKILRIRQEETRKELLKDISMNHKNVED